MKQAKRATPFHQENLKDDFFHLSAMRMQVDGAAQKFFGLLQLQLQLSRGIFRGLQARAHEQAQEEIQKESKVKNPINRKNMQVTNKLLLWCRRKYGLLCRAWDEGERIHLLVEQRKEEARNKAAVSSLPHRFI